MAQLRLALAQVNPTVGDLAGNAELVRPWTAKAAERRRPPGRLPRDGAHRLPGRGPRPASVVRRRLPDGAVAGSPQTSPPTAWATCRWSSATSTARRAGAVDTDPSRELPQNCAAVLHRGSVVARYAKHHLPNYGVFDETRFFVPGHALAVVRVRGVDVALTICEDLWQEGGPVSMAREAGAELLLVLNGSPYERDKDDTRLELAARRAGQAGCTLAYLNMVGGQDELVFDGDSMVVGADGSVLARAPQFAEDLLVLDLDLAESTFDPADVTEGVVFTSVSDEPAPAVCRATGSRGAAPRPGGRGLRGARPRAARLRAQERLPSVLLGLSGGIDSALVAAIAVDALGADERRTASRCRASTPRSTPRTTPPTWPSGPGCTTGSSPDRADGRRVPRQRSR